jgi:hypothetical protein
MNMKKMDNTPLFFISAAKRGSRKLKIFVPQKSTIFEGFFDPPFSGKKCPQNFQFWGAKNS